MAKQAGDHRLYRVRGKFTHRKRRRTKLSAGPKCKPGARFSEPWVCPNPEFHSGQV